MRLSLALLLVVVVLLGGCAGAVPDRTTDRSTLSLSVQNAGESAEAITVEVTAPNGSVVYTATESLQPGVAASFETTVDAPGRYVVTVAGDDWTTEYRWNAETCRTMANSVLVSGDRLENAGGCQESA